MLITGSPEMAEDAFHEAIARVKPRFDDLDRPGAYLRVVVVNVAREMAKRTSIMPALPAPLTSSLDTRQVEIWSALQGLTERRRTAVILRYYLDLRVGEIAEMLDCRPGTVSSLLHRGLADLREELADDRD